MPRTIRELAEEYRRLAERCIDSLAEDNPICDHCTAMKCAEMLYRLGDSIEEELRRLAKRFPRTCLACRYSTPAYGTPYMCDLDARFCELGKQPENCNSFEPFPDL